MAKLGKGMLSSVEQAFVGRDEKRAPLKTPAWEARDEYEAEVKFCISSTPLVSAVNHMAARTFREKKQQQQQQQNESFFPPNFNVFIDLENRERARAKNK